MPNTKSIEYKYAKKLAESLGLPVGMSYVAKGSTTKYWKERYNTLREIQTERNSVYSHNVNVTIRTVPDSKLSKYNEFKADSSMIIKKANPVIESKFDSIPTQKLKVVFATRGRYKYTDDDIKKALRDNDRQIYINGSRKYYIVVFIHNVEPASPPIRHDNINSLADMPVYKSQFTYPNMGLEDSEYSAEFKEQGCGYATIKHALNLDKAEVHDILQKNNMQIPADNGLTSRQIAEVFRFNGYPCYILDLCGNIIASSDVANDERNRERINGICDMVFVFIVACSHIYTPKTEHRQSLIQKIKASKCSPSFAGVKTGTAPNFKLTSEEQPYDIVIADTIPAVIEENKNYHIATNNLYEEYFNYLRNGIIYGAIICGEHVSAIRVSKTSYIYANPCAMEYRDSATALGIKYTCQGLPQLAFQYMEILQHSMQKSLEKSLFNVNMRETMLSKFAVTHGIDKMYVYNRSQKDRKKGVDFYRQYASIALNGKFYYANMLSDFALITPEDKFSDDFLYYVETADDELFQGNGIYDPQIVKCGLDYGVITWENVKQRAPIIYSPTNDDIISQYIHNVYKLVPDKIAKQIVNMMIGQTAVAGGNNKLKKTILTNNIIEAQYYAHTKFEESTIRPIYLTPDNVIYQVSGYTESPKVDTAMLIRFAIVQRGRVQTWKLANDIRKAGGTLMHVKTDAVFWFASSKVNNPYITSKSPVFGELRYEKPDDKPDVNDTPSQIHLIQERLPPPVSDDWKIMTASETEYYEPTELTSCPRAYIDGPAGTGKTHILNALYDKLVALKLRVGKMAFTHVAAKLIKGHTLHSFLGIGIDGRVSVQQLKKIAETYDVLLIDEVSMIPLQVYQALIQLPEKIKIYGFGDFRQLPPVEDDANITASYKDTTMFKRLFCSNMIRLRKQCRADPTYAVQCADMFDEKRGLPDGVIHEGKDIYPQDNKLHITRSNNMRREINAVIMRSKPDKISRNQADIGYAEFPVVYARMPVIANATRNGYHNNQEFKIVSINANMITLSDNMHVPAKKFYADFRPAYAITAYKSQGRTINSPYVIWEMAAMNKYSQYTVLTRTTRPELVTIANGGVATVSDEPTLLDLCKIDIEPIKNEIKTIPYYKFGDGLNNKMWHTSIEMAENDPHTRSKNILIGRDVWYDGADRCSRQFAYFDDYKTFNDYYETVPQHQRHFHEMLREDKNRQLFIDYDQKIDGWFNATGLAIVNDALEAILYKSIKAAFMKTFNIELEYRDIKIVNNSRPGKLSAHAFVTSHVGDSATNKRYAESVKAELLDMNRKLMPGDGLDLQVYGALKSLRIAGSSKLGYDAYPKKMERFMAGCFDSRKVSYVGYEKAAKKIAIETCKEIPADLGQLIEGNPTFKHFRFRDMKGDIGRFYRLSANHCDICNREHDNDNTMLVTKKGTVWMRGCWRVGMNKLIIV